MDPDDAVMLTDVVPTGYQAAEMAGRRAQLECRVEHNRKSLVTRAVIGVAVTAAALAYFRQKADEIR